MALCPYCHGSGRTLDDVRRAVRTADGFWLKSKKKVAFLIEFLKDELNLDKARISARKLVRSAGVLITSYESAELQENLLSRNLIISEEDSSLVESILLEKRISANGSIEAFGLRKGEKPMTMIHKRKIWWESVPGASSYVLFLSEDKEVFEINKFLWEATPGIISKQVFGKTELILPDEWPEFPKGPGTYYIGITSKDELGNQSDPFIISGSFKFFAPPAPSRGGIEPL